jgi:5'/3'-nucleotidase SurE
MQCLHQLLCNLTIFGHFGWSHSCSIQTSYFPGPFVYSLSGTCGAAYASVMAGTPAIAFSAYNYTHRPYYDINQDDHFDPALLAGEMMASLVSSLADGYDKNNVEGKQVLPKGIGLNVNFPYLNSSCSTPPYILSRKSRRLPATVPRGCTGANAWY